MVELGALDRYLAVCVTQGADAAPQVSRLAALRLPFDET
jgi:hypothetical protein